MRTHQEIYWLTAQVKLLKGHIQEWKRLLLAEKQSRRSLKQDHLQERARLGLMNSTDRRLATAQLITRQVEEFTRLTQQHMIEQRSLKSRQRQEQTNLDALIKPKGGESN